MNSEPAGGADRQHALVSATPRVSVIIIFLDAENYLGEAIESVVVQTLADWELILVDDGSGDGSTGMAKEWAARRPGQIRYVEHPGHANRGMSASRNRGIGAARGDYIAFLDSDDVYLPDRLARHASILDQWPQVDMVQSDQIYWYCWQDRRGRSHEESCSRPPLVVGDAVIHPPQGLLTLFGVPDAFTAPCSFTIRRAAALDLGGFEAEFRSLYEDQVFLTKVYARKIVYSHAAYLARYRLHGSGAFSTAAASVRGTENALADANRRLREWQAKYLAGVIAGCPLVGELLAAHSRRATKRRAVWLQALTTYVRQASHRLTRKYLPLPAYRRLLHRRQEWSAARASMQHELLCSRLGQDRLGSWRAARIPGRAP